MLICASPALVPAIRDVLDDLNVDLPHRSQCDVHHRASTVTDADGVPVTLCDSQARKRLISLKSLHRAGDSVGCVRRDIAETIRCPFAVSSLNGPSWLCAETEGPYQRGGATPPQGPTVTLHWVQIFNRTGRRSPSHNDHLGRPVRMAICAKMLNLVSIRRRPRADYGAVMRADVMLGVVGPSDVIQS